MGLYCDFDIINDYGFIESTPIFEIYPDYSDGCQAFVDTFLQMANEFVPVDTGYLKSTLDAGTDGVWCYAETICEYAQYPEYGTWCQSAQPYFEPAIQMALAAAIPLWEMAQMDALYEEEMLIQEQMAEQQSMMEESGDSGGFGFGGILQMLLMIILVAILTLIEEFFKDFFSNGTSNSSGGGEGGGSVFMPEIYII